MGWRFGGAGYCVDMEDMLCWHKALENFGRIAIPRSGDA